ncbi:methionine adenosyltransferase [Asanoa sp. NPDC049518]|uniref:methionine adenosyltransferase n=1 Tax=unclassified Asanoa TaxID=2685164 RepID=UPI0034485ECA
MRLVVLPLRAAAGDAASVEVVERKGIGHPDTLCDAIAERASQLYALHCLDVHGRVAHHWFDKVMLVGGEAVTGYGNGILVRPYELVFAGKAAFAVGGDAIPVEDLLVRAARDVLGAVLRQFDVERDIRIHNMLVDHRGSGRSDGRYRPRTRADLLELDDPARVSNDCNVLTAFAPFSRLEELVLDIEQQLTGEGGLGNAPDIGVDVKIVGTRVGHHVELVVNVPFIAAEVPSQVVYERRQAELAEFICERARHRHGLDIELTLNPGPQPYLTVTGSVADTGDVGVVGRGNRSNGLITPMRPMSIEAASGKNPLDHTGKIYSRIADQLAASVATASGGNVVVTITTAKGRPINDPDLVAIECDEPLPEDIAAAAAASCLDGVHEQSRAFIFGDEPLW